MKQTLFVRLMLMLLTAVLVFSGCSMYVDPPETETPTDSTQLDGEYIPESTAPEATQKTLESGLQYEILELDAWEYAYVIYDSQGNVVLQTETGGAYPEICLLGDSVLAVRVKMGTGIYVHRYYDVENNRLSREYQDVVACDHGYVVYVEVPKENPLQEHRLVAERLFEENAQPQTFNLDLAPVLSPVLDADFADDGKAITITYLSGDNQQETTQTIDLT